MVVWTITCQCVFCTHTRGAKMMMCCAKRARQETAKRGLLLTERVKGVCRNTHCSSCFLSLNFKYRLSDCMHPCAWVRLGDGGVQYCFGMSSGVKCMCTAIRCSIFTAFGLFLRIFFLTLASALTSSVRMLQGFYFFYFFQQCLI